MQRMTGTAKISLFQWLLILVPAVVFRVIYGWAIAPEPHFEKYLNLATQWLDGSFPAPFSSSPVYILWMAALVRIFGASVTLFRAIQFTMGLVTVILVTLTAKRMFSIHAGVAAGILYAWYGPVLVYEGDMVTAPLMILLAVAALYLFHEAIHRPAVWRWLVSGVLLGIATGIRPTMLLLIFFCSAWALVLRKPVRTRIILAVSLAAGGLLTVSPITLFNRHHCGEFIPVTSSGGSVFYSSNNYRATGLGYSPPQALTEIENEIMLRGSVARPVEHQLFKFLAERAAGRHLTYREVSSFYFDEGMRFLKQDTTAGAMLWVRKLFYLLNQYEVHDTASLVQAGNIQEKVFPFLPGFAVMFVLGSTGMILLGKNRRVLLLILMFILPHLIAGVVFYANGRLRVPIVPFLAVTGGFAVVRLQNYVRRRHPAALMLVIWMAGMAVLSTSSDDMIRWHRDVRTPSFLSTMQGMASMKSGHPDRAAAEFQAAVEMDPLGAREAHANLAQIYFSAGNRRLADREQRLAAGAFTREELEQLQVTFRMDKIQHQTAMATALWRGGDRNAAARMFSELNSAYPFHPDPLYNLGIISYTADPPDWSTAYQCFRQALDNGLNLELQSTRAYRLAAQCLLEMGRSDEAGEAEKQADWEKSLTYPGISGS